MTAATPLRMGLIGLGGISVGHLRALDRLKEEVSLRAVCDIVPERVERVAAERGVKGFTDYRAMIASGLVEAVAVATPHPAHPETAVYALERGVHTLTEKPLACDVASARPMVEAARRSGAKLGVVFQKRADPAFRAMKDLLNRGELGRIFRMAWTVTSYFRTQSYYNSGGWRGTWAGEGGGVLINQCPHQLDLLTWLMGMPRRVMARAKFGKYHRIQVEDEVIALMEWDDDVTGVFTAGTGEVPSQNRLEIFCERGRLLLEGDALIWERTSPSVPEAIAANAGTSQRPAVERVEIPCEGKPASHEQIYGNFARAVRGGEPLIASGDEAMCSLELGNAIILSSERNAMVELPIDAAAYSALLERKIAASRA